MKHFLAIILFLCAFSAQAADLYYCKCDTGAHGSCVAGADGNAGTSSGSPKENVPSEATISAAAAGDRFFFCKGGAWTGLSAIRVSNLNSTAASRITFDAYDSSFDTSTKPILSFADGEHGFRIGVFGPPDFNSNTSDDKGYIIRGLDIRGGTGTNRGFEIVGLVADILIDNVRISGFHKGVIIHKTTTYTVKRLVIRDSLIENNRTDGILGIGTEDTVVEGNTISGNNTTSGDGGGCAAGFCHAAYLGSDIPATKITIRNNTFTNNSVGSSGNCSGGNLTARGQLDQMVIEGNVITETTYSSGCGGLSMNEGYFSQEWTRRLIIRGNTIVGSYGSLGAISMNLGAGAIIENNRIIDNISGVTTGSGMNIGIHSAPEGDDFADNVIVRNNTVYLLYANNAAGISISSRSGHSVYNNLVYTGASSTSRCFAHGAIGIYALWDYNHCERDGSGNWSGTYTTLANAQAAGFDTNGTEGDPLFNNTPSSGNSWDLSVQSGSPVVGTGRNTDKPIRDVLWCNRKNPPDKGAHDRSATPCLTIRAPILVR